MVRYGYEFEHVMDKIDNGKRLDIVETLRMVELELMRGKETSLSCTNNVYAK